MPYDYQAAVAAAVAAVERSGNSESGEYKYKLIYPSKGSVLTVRVLFNPKSGQILRLINRHEKTACLRTYNMECPICKVMEEVKNLTGQDPFGRSKASKARGLMFAEFISSTSPYEGVKSGDFIICMFPWSVYTTISQIIQAIGQTPTGMDQAFGHAAGGLFVQITVDNDFRYNVVQVPYMTSPIQRTDEEFLKILEGMDSLYDQVLPSTMTPETEKAVKEYTDTIYRSYISPNIPNQEPVNVAPQVATQMVPPTPVPQYSYMTTTVPNPDTNGTFSQFTSMNAPQNEVPFNGASVVNTSGQPACFGNHQDGTPKCICCPAEVMCMGATK